MSEDIVVEVVDDAIAVYENRSGTPEPNRIYHAEEEQQEPVPGPE